MPTPPRLAKKSAGRQAVKQSSYAALLDAVEDFRAAAPWEHFANLQYFGVNLPDGEPALACVLGNGGGSFGLVLYLGPGCARAIKTLRAHHARQAAPFGLEDIVESSYIRVEFVDREDLGQTDQKALLATGWTPQKGRSVVPAWIRFETNLAGGSPVTLFPASDHPYLTAALRQVVMLSGAQATHDENDDDGFWKTKPDAFPFLAKEAGETVIHWKSMSFSRDIPPAPFATIGRVRALPASDEVWEAGALLTTMIAPEKVPGSRRRWFRRMLVIGRFQGAGKPIMPMMPSRSAKEGLAEDLAPLNLLDAIESAGCRPTEILVEDEALHAALAGTCATIGVSLRRAKNLGVTPIIASLKSGAGMPF